jgi:hypothetical protein
MNDHDSAVVTSGQSADTREALLAAACLRLRRQDDWRSQVSPREAALLEIAQRYLAERLGDSGQCRR